MAERAHPEDPGFQGESPYRVNLFKRYAFASKFTEGKKVLDIPCGVGWGTSLLNGKHKIGIDISSDAIAYANKHYPGIDFLVGDMANIPLEKNSIDVVVCLEGFEHVSKETGTQFLQEAAKVIKSNGLLIMTIPVILPGDKHSGNPYHLHEPALSDLKNILSQSFCTQSIEIIKGPDGPVVYFVGNPKNKTNISNFSHKGMNVGYPGKGKSNVLLTTSAAPVQSPFSTGEKRPPIGIGFLISVLRNAGHKAFFIDNYLQPSNFIDTNYLQKYQVDYIGIYANTICFRDTLRMIYKLEHLRQTHKWNGKIIIGGPHATVAPHTIPDFVDYVVQGEGEQAILDIVDGKVEQRIVKYPRMENLDMLPMPAWDCFVELPYDWSMKFFEDKPIVTMNTSRGCPFSCTFCSVGSIWGRKYTYFSAERIVSDIEYLIEHYGVKGIYFREDNFTLNEERLRKFCNLLIDKETKISWACESRVSGLTRDIVELMARAGAKGFYFGVESGSQKMLDFLHKGITVEQIRNAFKWCHEFNVKAAASIIVGVPGETESDRQKTDELLNEIKPDVIWTNIFVGIPNSNLYHFALDNRLYEYIDDRDLVYLQGHNSNVKRYKGGNKEACIPDSEENKDMTIRPEVSVLVCVHNCEKYIEQALKSIYDQTYQDFEVVIVDDASTDKTSEILVNMKDSRTFIYRNSENKGLTKSLNIGLKLCRGEYIARMDADDISLPQRFEKQVKFSDENPNCAAVGSWCFRIDSNGKVCNKWEHPEKYQEIKKKLLTENSVFHGSAMIRRCSLMKIGGYKEKYKYAQDYDMWLRLSEIAEVRNIGEYLYALRFSPENISATRKKQQDEYAALAKQEALQRRNIQKLKMTSETYSSASIDGKNFRDSAVDYFLKAGKEFNRGNFEAAVEYMQQYRSMIDYFKFPRILNKSRKRGEINVSVIIVTYNRTEDLKKCLESLSKQDDTNFEVIVVDNGGSDFEVFQQYVDQYIRCPINLILSEGRNIGACCAKGKIIAFLDDDALVPSNYVSSIKAAFQKFDIYGLRGKSLPKNNPEANRNAKGYDRGSSAFPTFCDLEGNSAFLRKVYLSFDGMDPLLFGHEGSDLTYRIAEKHKALNKVIYWPDTVIYHDAVTGDAREEKLKRYRFLVEYLRFKHNIDIFGLRSEIEKHHLPETKQPKKETTLQCIEKGDRRLKMQVIGTEYGGWAVDLDLIPYGSTVISAGVGEDISFDSELIKLKNCKVIGIDPTEKAKKYVEKNKNERFVFLQKALCSESDKKVKFYKSSNPDYVSESVTPSHNMVTPSEFYEAETISLQELLKKHKNISVLKMDIEGAEYQVLNSVSELDIPQICIEFHHFCTDFTVDDTERCIEHLNKMGYVVAHCTRKCGSLKEATFVHQKYISKTITNMNIGEPETHITKDIPVILICYNRPKHTLEVLKALRQHDVKNMYIFSDAPKRQEDVEAVSLIRRLVHSINWTKPKIIERTENLGLARSIVGAVEYVFERHDRLILLEDDCVPQRYFFDFMQTCLAKYENNPKVFGISGYTVPVPGQLLQSYPYDLYFCPRIGSWGWATWKRAWQHYKKDLHELVKIASERNIDLTQGGTDIPVSVENFLKGQLKDVWTLNWVLSVYLNNGGYIYPASSHIQNIGMDDTGLHCGRTDKYESPCSDIRPERYPADVFLDERIMANFKNYYQATPERSLKAISFLKSLPGQRPLKIAQISTVDKKGGAARVAWMLKEGLKARGMQTKMFVKENFSGDDDVQIITNPIIDSGDDYKKKGLLYYDIKSTSLLSRNEAFISSDIFHFHNLHGDYFNPFALAELTKIRPSVWTLHDMQGITGHCAYAFDCPKWQSGCGNCPHPESYPPIMMDSTAQMWEDKRRIYQDSDMELIVPSKWLKNIVEKSILRDKETHLIYNGIDERIYQPCDKHAIRRMFKIPPNSIIIGFVAHGGLADKRKGGDFILEAYRYFTSKYPNVCFLCVGGTSDEAPTERFLQVPFVLDETMLVQFYCAADIFLFPTLADNCPMVVLEVMGCGVPIVSFNAGGVPELIEHGKTGLIAELKSSKEFIRHIEYLMANKTGREEFGIAGRERLLKMFTLDRMIDKHISLYERLAENTKKKDYVSPRSRAALPISYSEKKHKYLVSAIVSTYNSEKFIRQCLDDLENQTIADKLEIIVVNSGSQQNEEAIVKEFQQKYDNIKYIKTDQREGIYTAWNRAIEAARGRFITNANTDDRHRKDAFEIMAATLDANPDVALVYGDQIRTDTTNDNFDNHHGTEMLRRPDYSRERLLLGCCVGSQPMWRKALHNEFGYFDEMLTCAADWDFWLRISDKYDFKRIPEFLGLYYHNENGIEHSREIHSLYERYIVGKRYGTPYISVIPLYRSSNNPLVSVIMPAYNAAAYIAEAIESVLIQNYRNFELIVVDDGSADNTKNIIAGFEDDKIKYFYKERNTGAASARNLAIQKSEGTFIINLDADDVMTPDFIAGHLQEFEKHPDVELVYCDDCLIDENGKPIRVIERPEYTDQKLLIRDLFRCGFPLVPFRTCIRRSVFDEIGFFDERLLVAEDYDMMRRFVKSGLKIHHLAEALYLRRMAPDSLSRNFTAQKAKSHFEVARRFTDTFKYEELFPDVKWDKIAPHRRQLHAKCLAAVTYLTIGQAYVKSNSPAYAEMAFGQACSELNGCLGIDPENRQARQLLQKCESARVKSTEALQQAVC